MVGENGAGKTTLMRILAGVERADRGRHHGRRPGGHHRRCRGRLPAGHRDGPPALHAVPVAERGREPDHRPRAGAPRPVRPGRRGGGGQAPRRRLRPAGRRPRRGSATCRWATSSGWRSCARSTGAPAMLILDEPTAVLTPQEARGLFRVIRELRAAGRTTVFISHKLDEVLDIADRITVLRDGAGHRAPGRAPSADAAQLARLMVGRRAAAQPAAGRREPGAPVLEVRGLRGPGIRGIDLSVRAGEIVGVAGVAGNGQTELAELISGLLPVAAGTVRLAGRDVTRASVAGAARRGPRLHPRRPLPARPRRGRLHRRQPRDGRPSAAPPVARGAAVRPRARSVASAPSWSAASASRRARWPTRPARCRAATRSASSSRGSWRGSARHRRRAAHPGHRHRGDSLRPRRAAARRAAGAGILLIRADLTEVLALADRIVVLFAGRHHGRGARRRRGPGAAGPVDGGCHARRAGRRDRATVGRRGGDGCRRSLTRRGSRRATLVPRVSRLAGAAAGARWSRSAWAWPWAPSRSCSRAASPIEAYGELLRGAVGTPSNLNATLARAVPIVVVGVGLAIAFRAGALNLGGEGQMIMAAVTTAVVANQLGGLPAPARASSPPPALGASRVPLWALGPTLAPGTLRGAAAHHDPAAQLRRGAARRVSGGLSRCASWVAGSPRRPPSPTPRSCRTWRRAVGSTRACCCCSCCRSPRGGC